MALKNKLGINDSAELARVEEKISKTKAINYMKATLLKILKLGIFQCQNS